MNIFGRKVSTLFVRVVHEKGIRGVKEQQPDQTKIDQKNYFPIRYQKDVKMFSDLRVVRLIKKLFPCYISKRCKNVFGFENG